MSLMDASILEAYLHEHIPLSAAMGVRVAELTFASVRLSAPLAPNVNHRSTAFGGSIASLATLAGWSLTHARLIEIGYPSRVVIMASQIEYLAPASFEFTATCSAPIQEDWDRFVATLVRRGKSRLTLAVAVTCGEALVATLQGTFVALSERSA